MSESVPKKTVPLSAPAQELLEQYKTYREDGIVEIKEPIQSSQNEEQKIDKTAIVTKMKQKTKMRKKRSTIIKSLNSKQSTQNTANKTETEAIGGYDDSWWNELTKAENSAENECKHKLDNIALMQKYENEKDISPFNQDNRMHLQKDWEHFFKKENESIADQYFDKMDKSEEKTESKRKTKSKKRVKFAQNLVTKQGSSENVMENSDKKPTKNSQLPSPKTKKYGNLVGFFNKPNPKKNNKKPKTKSKSVNPYLDTELMKGFTEFTPDKNQTFEHKFDPKTEKKPMQQTIIESNEFKSMIIPSNEFKTNETNIKIKPKQKSEKSIPAFNGHIFERKPPDLVYVCDKNKEKTVKQRANTKPQSLPKISQPKTSLFRQSMAKHSEIDINQIEVIGPKENLKDKTTLKQPNKKVRFSENLITKQLVINANDKYLEREDICLIFLDVDGVLNCSYSPPLSKAHILRLKKILNRTHNCKICISSSWRVYKQTRMQLLHGLKEIGNIDISAVVIGDTPKLRKNALKYRAEEIKFYLENNAFLNENYNVLRWCAIDDIPLDTINREYTQFMTNHFVKTNPAKGLTDYDCEKVVSILNGTVEQKLEVISEENMQLTVVNKATKKVKLLFLDVDGVLNYTGFDDRGVNGALCMDCLRRLKNILDRTECKIVLSTSWRRIPSAKEQLLRQLSSQVGIDVSECVIGETPVLGSEMKKSVEICQYLESVRSEYEIVSWVAIDDMPLHKIGTKKAKEMLKNNFVQTDINIGLSDKNVMTAVSILNAHKQ